MDNLRQDFLPGLPLRSVLDLSMSPVATHSLSSFIDKMRSMPELLTKSNHRR
jgi:hypothetical protein